MMSKGETYSLVLASLAKSALQGAMSPEMRLEFLGHLEKMTDGVLTPEIISIVEPMDARGWEIYLEAAKLGFSHRPGVPCAFDVLYAKFDLFCALNPSLQRAYDEACRPWQRSA
jgi:hypothetical protein